MTQLHFLLLALFLPAGFAFGNQVCEADHQCDIDSYCYQDSHLCVPCTECSAYKRQKSIKICAKKALECGPCLPNFEEEFLSIGRREFCIASQINSDSSNTINSLTLILLIIFSIFLLLLTIGIIFTWYRYNKNKARERRIYSVGNPPRDIHEIERLSPAPPPPYPEIELESREIVFNISSSEEQKLNQASVFRDPDSPYKNSPPTAPDLQDEDTAPSDWTPGGGYSGSADFSGLFPIAAASSAPERLNETSDENNSSDSSLEVASINIPPGDNDSGLTTPTLSNSSSLVGQATGITVPTVPTTSNHRQRLRRHSLENTTAILAKRPRRCEVDFDSGTISQEGTSADENQSNSDEEHHRRRTKSKTLP